MRGWLPAWLPASTLIWSARLASAQPRDDAGLGAAASLPKSSSEFLARHSCAAVPNDDELDAGLGESFFRWVLAARHTTWTEGWEVTTDPGRPGAGAGGQYERRYARVFDLLNWSREHAPMPVSVDVAEICHKGMEGRFANGAGGGADDSDFPSECRKKLRETTRVSSACVDVPGVLVESPAPSRKANNPCGTKYRMVDGAHRLCLRKYLLTLLAGELEELEAGRENDETTAKDSDRWHDLVRQKRRLIDQTARGMFFVMDQITFESMLMSSDPRTSWARDRDTLMSEATEELRREWKEWMRKVMERVEESKAKHQQQDCENFPTNDLEPSHKCDA